MSATKITKVWNNGDLFLATDADTILKGTINDIIDDNIESHIIEKGTGQNTIQLKSHVSKAVGNYSVAFGSGTVVNGENSFGVGKTIAVGGNYSFASGDESEAGGHCATAMGYKCESNANYSFTCGQSNICTGHNSAVIGGLNQTETEPNIVNVPNLRLNNISTNENLVQFIAIDSAGKTFIKNELPYFYQIDSVPTLSSNYDYEQKLALTIPIHQQQGLYKIEFDINFWTKQSDSLIHAQIICGTSEEYATQSYANNAGSAYRTTLHGVFYYTHSTTNSEIIKINMKATDNTDEYTTSLMSLSATLIDRS